MKWCADLSIPSGSKEERKVSCHESRNLSQKYVQLRKLVLYVVYLASLIGKIDAKAVRLFNPGAFSIFSLIFCSNNFSTVLEKQAFILMMECRQFPLVDNRHQFALWSTNGNKHTRLWRLIYIRIDDSDVTGTVCQMAVKVHSENYINNSQHALQSTLWTLWIFLENEQKERFIFFFYYFSLTKIIDIYFIFYNDNI